MDFEVAHLDAVIENQERQIASQASQIAQMATAIRWASVLITTHVKPEKCVHINGEMKSAKDIFGLLVAARTSWEGPKDGH